MTPVAPGAGVPTGLVRFVVDGVEVGTASLAGGVATLDHVVPSGATRTVLASYLGSGDFAGSGPRTCASDPTISIESAPASGAASELGWYDGAGPGVVHVHAARVTTGRRPARRR